MNPWLGSTVEEKRGHSSGSQGYVRHWSEPSSAVFSFKDGETVVKGEQVLRAVCRINLFITIKHLEILGLTTTESSMQYLIRFREFQNIKIMTLATKNIQVGWEDPQAGEETWEEDQSPCTHGEDLIQRIPEHLDCPLVKMGNKIKSISSNYFHEVRGKFDCHTENISISES